MLIGWTHNDNMRVGSLEIRLVGPRQKAKAARKSGLSLPPKIFERLQKNYIGRVPQFGGNRAARAAGDNDFEELGRGGEIHQQGVLCCGRLRLRNGKMPQNRKNIFFGWRK